MGKKSKGRRLPKARRSPKSSRQPQARRPGRSGGDGGAEAMFQALFESSRDAIMLLDASGFFDCNRATLEMFGLSSRDEFIAVHPSELSPPRQADGSDSRTAADSRIAAAFREGHQRFKWLHRRKSGEVFPAEVWLTAFPLGDRPVLQATVRDITERKRDEEALRQSEQRMRLHVEQTPLAVIEWDTKFQVIRWNPGAEKTFGYPAAEALGRHGSFILPARVKPMVDRVFRELLARKGGERVTSKNITRDGRTILCEWYNTPLVGSDGNVVGVASLAQDVTERKQAEERVLASERRFRAVIDQTFGFIGFLTKDGTLTDVNDTALTFSGVERADVVGRPFWEGPWWKHSPEAQARVREAVGRAAAGEVVRFETTHPAADGSIHHVDFSLKPVTDENGEVALLLPEGRDITESKEIEEALRESERKLLALIDLLPDAAFIIDRDGRIAAWNKAIENLLGYRAEEMLGKGDHEYAIPFYGERRPILIDLVRLPDAEIESKYTTVRRQGDVLIGEAYVEPPRGKRSYMIGLARALYDEKGEYAGAVEIAHDLTERKLLEMSLQSAKEVAESAARARTEFVANMSHEIRTPMNGIMGMLDLALATDLNREQREYLGLAKSAADSLLTVIDDILDFSKIESKKMDLERVEFRLCALCEEILPLVGLDAHKKGLELVCSMDPEAPDVLVGDPVRLKQVLVNLLKNAVKFTEKGHVLLRAEKRGEIRDGVCELHFSVADTGVGIPEDKREIIFESFAQADSSMTRRYGGTGLGLTISKRLVEMMGGAIWVESRLGAGSTFHFTVPFRVGGGGRSILKRRPPELRGLRALVVDDHEVNRMILRGYLESWEMAVDEANDGPACIQRLRDSRAGNREYGVILLDCMMPGMSGFDVAGKLVGRDRFENPIIIMISSMEERGSRERCRELGIAQFLVKPVSPSTLYNAIVSAVGIAPEETEPGRRGAGEAAKQELPADLRILVAEDNPVNIEVVKRLLQRAGLGCEVARDGRQAVDAVEKGNFDIALMDIQMPVMDGMEATRLIREREKSAGGHLVIVALTAHSMKGDRERFMAGGMDDYLSKPLDAARLYETIARHARRRSARRPGDAGAGSAVGGARAHLPLLDPRDLTDRMGGDRGLVAEVLAMFVKEADAALAGVEAAAAGDDPQKLRSAAHYFKSMSANVSAGVLREVCYQLETLGASGDLAEARRRLAGLRDAVRWTVAAVRGYLDR